LIYGALVLFYRYCWYLLRIKIATPQSQSLPDIPHSEVHAESIAYCASVPLFFLTVLQPACALERTDLKVGDMTTTPQVHIRQAKAGRIATAVPEIDAAEPTTFLDDPPRRPCVPKTLRSAPPTVRAA